MLDIRQAQLFVDDEVIAHQMLLQRIVHTPVRWRGNPLLWAEKPWEGASIAFLPGVYRDDATGQFRAWYACHTQAYPGYQSMFCLATSEDGLHWERPALDLCREIIGGPSNVLYVSKNILDGLTVLHDPEDAERAWKLIFWQAPGIYFGHSPDGIYWNIPSEQEPPFLTGFGDRTTSFLASETDEPYVVLSRDKVDMYNRYQVRCMYRIGSPDARTISSPAQMVMRPDMEDGPAVEFYQMSAFRYESLYLGFIERYQVCEPPYADIELACSRDGRRWERVRPRQAFFAPPPHARDSGMFDIASVTPAHSPPILKDGALWIYYDGGSAYHGDRFLAGDRCLALAKLRPDGFVSLRAGRREAELVTKPFTWPGGKVQINYRVMGGNLRKNVGLDLRSDGWLRTEILDDDGNVVPGYSRDDNIVLYRDALNAEPTWTDGQQNLDSLTGKTIALRFLLREAEIYSFRAMGSDMRDHVL